MMAGEEFFEGVRALLIDRDNSPNWNPATRSAVSEAIVNRYFEKLPDEPDLDLNLT
jgi:enoyl-CoA hydratase